MDSTLEDSKNFIKHVFNFDDDSKAEVMNIVQYAIVAIIPIVIINKTISKYVPEADEDKGNIELLGEVLLQVVLMFLGLLLVHRINTFIPTYSGVKYPEYDMTFSILSCLMIVLSLQTKLGEKVNILSLRIYELWNGNKDEEIKKTTVVKVSNQQQSQQPQLQQVSNVQQTFNDGTSIHSLPVNNSMPNTQIQQPQQPQQPQQFQDNQGGFDPVAASDMIGGFSTW